MTAEQFHDALGLLPSDLIAETDALRNRPRKPVIQWKRWAAMAACAVLVLGCGLAAARILPGFSGGGTEKLAITQDMAAAEIATEAPAAMAPADAAGEEECDCAESVIVPEAANGLEPTGSTPPVNVGGAEFRFGELSIYDEVHLIKNPAGMEALGLEPDIYDEDWFADYDLLLIALPGVTSHEGLDISVGQGMDPQHWEIRIENLPEVRADCADSLLICIPVHKGHIPRDAAFTLIYE